MVWHSIFGDKTLKNAANKVILQTIVGRLVFVAVLKLGNFVWRVAYTGCTNFFLTFANHFD